MNGKAVRRRTGHESPRTAGYTRRTYVEILGRRGVPAFNYDPDELDQELETIQTFPARAGRRGTDVAS